MIVDLYANEIEAHLSRFREYELAKRSFASRLLEPLDGTPFD